jgi:hypothetical protein
MPRHSAGTPSVTTAAFIAIYGELPLTRDQEHLAALITARPDATLMELREALRTTARLSTLWREIDRLGLTEIGTGRRTAAP